MAGGTAGGGAHDRGDRAGRGQRWVDGVVLGQEVGLRSVHAEVVAYRGGIEREDLEALIEAGRSTRQIAEALDRSQSTIRHWLKRYGLSTAIARRRGVEGGDTTSVCRVHGTTPFRRDANGT